MSPDHPQPRPKLVVRYVLLWVVAGAVLSAGEGAVTGYLSAPILAVDLIAAVQLPLGFVAVAMAAGKQAEDGPAADDDEDDGRGGLPPHWDPLPPSGGLEIDWQRFEADVQAWAQSRELLV